MTSKKSNMNTLSLSLEQVLAEGLLALKLLGE